MGKLPTFRNLGIERKGNVFIITLQKPPENRLSSWFCQEIIRAFHTVQKILGPDSEGAVITRGSDAKFFCTVRLERVNLAPNLRIEYSCLVKFKRESS
jgi:hypothetical protein